MRRVPVTVGTETFEFQLRDGFVSINVKCYADADPQNLAPELKARWDLLTPKTHETLIQFAWREVQEAWWDESAQLVSERGLGSVTSGGRSGGYLLLRDWGENDLFYVEEDDRSSGCLGCRYLANPEGHAKLHRAAKSLWDSGQLPLPFSRDIDGAPLIEPLLLDCGLCQEPYYVHHGTVCTPLLGAEYRPHPYASDALDRIRVLENTLDELSRSAAKAVVQPRLDAALAWLVEQRELYD